MKKLKKSEAVTTAAICAAGMVILEYAPITLFPSEPLNTLAKTACSRCLGAVMFLVLLLWLGYRVFDRSGFIFSKAKTIYAVTSTASTAVNTTVGTSHSVPSPNCGTRKPQKSKIACSSAQSQRLRVFKSTIPHIPPIRKE